MTKQQTQSKLSSQIDLSYISLAGIFRGIIGMPIQHPLETVKTWMQSQNLSFRSTIQDIQKKKGIMGFYSGFWISALRSISKQAYRWPLNIYLLSTFRKIFQNSQNSHSWAGLATGAATALIQSIIICPMERIKVWLMTSDKLKRYSHLYELKTFKSLFDGLQPVLLRQMISWITFLGSQQYIKDQIYKYKKKDRRQYELSLRDLAFVGISVSFINTFSVMPLDYIKTHYQKYRQSLQTNKSVLSFAKQTYKSYGAMTFYKGTGVRLLQYNINSFFTIPLFEKLLVSYEKSKENRL